MPSWKSTKHEFGDAHRYLQEGKGNPLVFQHGLGGSANQVFEVLSPLPGICLYSMNFRGHGSTEMTDCTSPTLSQLLEDQVWFSKQVVQQPHAMGGLSLGALVAVKLALASISMVTKLILLRPAWPTPECSVDFASAKSEIPKQLHSLLGLDPGFSLTELRSIQQPVMILGMPNDELHPISFSKHLACCFPSAIFHQIPDKRADEISYRDSIRKHTLAFLHQK
ncbi:MAG: alpha/beta hydrolase [Verrucomicrobia bacterium]|nr:MAG: alpha/beta hydrolase [Verrucomicrobiota bacterium]